MGRENWQPNFGNAIHLYGGIPERHSQNSSSTSCCYPSRFAYQRGWLAPDRSGELHSIPTRFNAGPPQHFGCDIYGSLHVETIGLFPRFTVNGHRRVPSVDRRLVRGILCKGLISAWLSLRKLGNASCLGRVSGQESSGSRRRWRNRSCQTAVRSEQRLHACLSPQLSES